MSGGMIVGGVGTLVDIPGGGGGMSGGISGGGDPDPVDIPGGGGVVGVAIPIIGGSIIFTVHATPTPCVTFLHGGGIRTAEIPTGFFLQD